MVKYYCTWGWPPRDSCRTTVPEAGLHGIAVLIVPDGELLSLEDQVLGAHLEPAWQRATLPIAHAHLKGTQDWEFFWLRFWNLRYFFVSYVKILRFYKNNFLIGPLLGEVRFFRVVLGLRGMKKNFEQGQKFFFSFLQLWTLNMTQYSFYENSIN